MKRSKLLQPENDSPAAHSVLAATSLNGKRPSGEAMRQGVERQEHRILGNLFGAGKIIGAHANELQSL